MAEDNPKFKLSLLGRRPQFYENGLIKNVSPQPFKLLIYLADGGQDTYLRDDVIHLMYGSTAEARDHFRRRALHPLRDQLPNLPIRAGKGDYIFFASDQIEVDSRSFTVETNLLLQQYPVFKKEQVEQAKTLLRLYVDHFLNDFHPKAGEMDESRYVAWQQTRQRELASLYHQLLDQNILFYIKQERYWGDAVGYALQWYKSLNPSPRVLQYLIWLADKVPQLEKSRDDYLNELSMRERNGELPMGMSSAKWKMLFANGETVTAAHLFEENGGVSKEDSKLTTIEVFARPNKLEEIYTAMRKAQPGLPFAIKGPPGVGKTEIAGSAARMLQVRNPEYRVVRVELNANLDLELICNAILSQLGKPELFSLDYGQKRQRLKQLLQAPSLLIIVDEGHTTHLANRVNRDSVVGLLSGARLMLVARDLPRFNHYVIDIQGLDETQTKAFLIQRIPWLQKSGETTFKELAELTEGLPLLLHIIVGGLKNERGRISSLLQRLRGDASNTERSIHEVYGSILDWLWQYLPTEEKDLLFTISLFAPEEGVTRSALTTVLSGIMGEQLPQNLRQLIDLYLIQSLDSGTENERYLLHPIIHEFVSARTSHPRRSYADRIEKAYVRYILDFIAAHHNHPDQLDKYQQNIFRTLERVLFDDDYPWAREQAVESLNNLYTYFERRGLFVKAAVLFEQVLNRIPLPSDVTRFQILLNFGKIEHTLSRPEQALKLFGRALKLAEKAKLTERMGGVYHAIGRVHMQHGRGEEAINAFKTAENWAKKNDQTALRYASWSNIGNCYYELDKLDIAQKYHQMVEQSLGTDLMALTPDLKAIATHNQNVLGLTLAELGEYDIARQHLQSAMELANQLNYPEMLGQIYLNLGVTYYYQKEYDPARDSFGRSKEIADMLQNTMLQADIMWNQGALASAEFSHKDAFRQMRSALIMVEDYQLFALKPRIYIAFGKAALRGEQYELASRCFIDVLFIENISTRHAAEAFYGLALSIVMKDQLIGKNDVSLVIETIRPHIEALPLAFLPFTSLSADEIHHSLILTHSRFERDLDHLPEFGRYRVLEALQTLLIRR